MQIRFSPGISEYGKLSSTELRAAYLVDCLFVQGKIELVYTDVDRAIIGSVAPTTAPLKLEADAELRAEFFCQRRELGVLNIGGPGHVEVDGKAFPLAKLDCLYVARGSQNVVFSSDNPSDPAYFYLLSYPAHAPFPTTLARQSEAETSRLGSGPEANHRTIYRCIHPRGIKSCQLVMGFTRLEEGSVWNTMPPHTHTRRSEIYMYFDLAEKRVMHFMGKPQETRHIITSDRQAVISPSWSIHCACGTGAYTFCWGMGGENQTFEDMDPAPLTELR